MLDEDVGTEGGAEEGGDSWFGNVRSHAGSIGSGGLFLIAILVLFWNEGYSQRHAEALSEIGEQIVLAPATTIDPALEGKPVHLSARVRSSGGAEDALFGVRVSGPALYREVYMYQWIEHAQTTGRGSQKRTRYHYDKDWDSEYHDSSQFHEPAGHHNPPPALAGDGFFAADARFGPFRFDNVEVARRAIWEMGERYPGSLGDWAREVTRLPALPGRLADRGWHTLAEDAMYYKGDPDSAEPEVGDLAVSFYELGNDYELSLVGAQSGEHLTPWKASNGDEVLLAAGGVRDAQTMVEDEQAFNSELTHTLRIAGLLGAVIGAAGMARWLVGFLGMIPVVGSLVTMSATIAGGLFGLTMGLVTIVVGWLAARPWIAALILIAIGTAITHAIQQKRKADKASKRTSRLAALNERARQMAAERLAGAGAMPAVAGGSALPPAPPAPGAARTPPMATPRPVPPPPPPEAEAKELPPLEWEPGLIATRPPAVRAKAPLAAAAQAAEQGAIEFVSAPPTAPQAVSRDITPLSTTLTTPQPPPLAGGARAPAAPAPMRQAAVEPPPASLFETVAPRQAAEPMFIGDSLPEFELPPEPPAPKRAPSALAATREIPVVATPPAPAAELLRSPLGKTGDYQIHRLSRRRADGGEEPMGFELSRNGQLIARGSQEEIKARLKALPSARTA